MERHRAREEVRQQNKRNVPSPTNDDNIGQHVIQSDSTVAGKVKLKKYIEIQSCLIFPSFFPALIQMGIHFSCPLPTQKLRLKLILKLKCKKEM